MRRWRIHFPQNANQSMSDNIAVAMTDYLANGEFWVAGPAFNTVTGEDYGIAYYKELQP